MNGTFLSHFAHKQLPCLHSSLAGAHKALAKPVCFLNDAVPRTEYELGFEEDKLYMLPCAGAGAL